MIDFFLKVLVLMIAVPVIVYFSTKLATFAALRARDNYRHYRRNLRRAKTDGQE